MTTLAQTCIQWKAALQKRAKLATILFFCLLFILGLLMNNQYGLPFDEPAEQVILQENLKEYAYQLLGEDSEAYLYYDSLSVQRISESIEKDHGQSPYYLAAPVLQLLRAEPDRASAFWHMYTWLWFMAGVLAIYGFGREMGWSRPVSCFTSLLLYLSPRFFAEGHYNNKDMVLLSLYLLTLWAGLRLLKKPCVVRGTVFSLMGALATNVKIVGIMPWALLSFCALMLTTARKEWSTRRLRAALCTLVSFVLFYALLTPAFWVRPTQYIMHVLRNASSFTRWKGVLIYKGMFIDQQKAPIPRLYLPTMMAVTTPLYVFPLAIVGQLYALWHCLHMLQKQKLQAFRNESLWINGALTLCWAVPLGFAMVFQPIVYNSWRHFYFVYAGIALLAGQGIHFLDHWLGRLRTQEAWWKRRSKALGAGLLGLCFAVSAIGIFTNHPYQYGYYNQLARKTAATDMELDYWNVCIVNAMRKLVDFSERNQALPLHLGSRDNLSRLGIQYGLAALPLAMQDRIALSSEPDVPYLLYNTTYAQIFNQEPPEGYRVLFELTSYGNVLCTVYERDE